MFDSSYEHSDYEDHDRDINEKRQLQGKMQQQVFSDESDVEDHVCNMATTREEVILRRPSKVEIDQITTSMVAQVQTRSMDRKAKNNKASGMFIKKINHKRLEIIMPKEVPTEGLKSKIRNGNPRGWNMPKLLNFKVMILQNLKKGCQKPLLQVTTKVIRL